MPILIVCLIAPLILLAIGVNMSSASLAGIHNLLIGVSGAVFTIMSIWIGLLYPNVLNTLKENHGIKASLKDVVGETNKLKVIVFVIIKSAATAIYVLLASVVVGVSEEIGVLTKLAVLNVLQYITLFFVGIQISAILSLIVINIGFIDAVDKKIKTLKENEDT